MAMLLAMRSLEEKDGGSRVAGRGSRNDAMIGDCRQSGLAGQGDGQYSVRSVNSLQAGAEAG